MCKAAEAAKAKGKPKEMVDCTACDRPGAAVVMFVPAGGWMKPMTPFMVETRLSDTHWPSTFISDTVKVPSGLTPVTTATCPTAEYEPPGPYTTAVPIAGVSFTWKPRFAALCAQSAALPRPPGM